MRTNPWMFVLIAAAIAGIVAIGNLYPGDAPVLERTVYVDTPSGKVLCIKGTRGNIDCDWSQVNR